MEILKLLTICQRGSPSILTDTYANTHTHTHTHTHTPLGQTGVGSQGERLSLLFRRTGPAVHPGGHTCMPHFQRFTGAQRILFIVRNL